MKDAIRINWLSDKSPERLIEDFKKASELRREGVQTPEAYEDLVILTNPFPDWMHKWFRVYFKWDNSNLAFYRYFRRSNRPSDDLEYPTNRFMDKRMMPFFKAQVDRDRKERIKYAIKYCLSWNPFRFCLSIAYLPGLIRDIWNYDSGREKELSHVQAMPVLSSITSPADCAKSYYSSLSGQLGDNFYQEE